MACIEEDLGAPVDELFEASSVRSRQRHSARCIGRLKNGQRVAVKVQRLDCRTDHLGYIVLREQQ